MSERYVSVGAFAQRLDTSRQQVHRWIRKGELSFVRVGRLIRIDAAEECVRRATFRRQEESHAIARLLNERRPGGTNAGPLL